MKAILQVCITTFATCALVPSATAENAVPGSRPGETVTKPAGPSNTKDHADRDDAAMNPANEMEFVKTAAKKGMAEVKIAQLAVEKAEDPKVKELAQMLVKDHTAANAALKPICETLGAKPADHADAKAQQKYDELSAMNGKEFDQSFLATMHKCHDKTIMLLEAGKKVAKSDEVIAYINTTLPVIKGHAEKIGELHGGVRSDGDPAPKPSVKAE